MRQLGPLVVILGIGLALLWTSQETAAKGNGEVRIAAQKDDDKRIVRKFAAGLMGGVGGGLAGAAVWVGMDDGSFGWEVPALLGLYGGNLIGTPLGVSAVDPHDDLLMTVAGSVLAGAGVPAAIARMGDNIGDGSVTLLLLSALLGPVVGAMTASELSREPGTRQLSLAVFPDHNGGLRAIAKLRL